MRHRTWFLVCLGCILVASAMGFYVGMGMRPPAQGCPAQARVEPPPPQDSTPFIRRMEVPRSDVAPAPDAMTFTYRGRWIDCWVEAEVGGKWVEVQRLHARDLRALCGPTGVPGGKEGSDVPEPAGSVTWARKASGGLGEVTSELILTADGGGQAVCLAAAPAPLLKADRLGDVEKGSSWGVTSAGCPLIWLRWGGDSGEVVLSEGVAAVLGGGQRVERKVRLKCATAAPLVGDIDFPRAGVP